VTAPDPRAGQEAARLLAAAQDWLRTSAPHLAPLSVDGVPCSCPVCRAVAGLREADPDAVGRWVDSAVSALGSLVAQAGDLAAAGAAAAQGDRTTGAGARGDGTEEPVVGGHADDATDRGDTDERYDSDAGQWLADQQDPAPRGVRRIRLDPTADDPEGQQP
jgi:hypothetical protein